VEGFVSEERYRAAKTETDGSTSFTLTLERLPRPFVKRWESLSGWLLDHYRGFLKEGFSLVAHTGGRLVGFLLPRAACRHPEPGCRREGLAISCQVDRPEVASRAPTPGSWGTFTGAPLK